MAIAFPRGTKPTEITRPKPREPLRSMGQSGIEQIRNVTQAGWTWQETFDIMRSGDVNDEAVLTSIEEGLNRGQDFTLKHLLTPGSGQSPMGTGNSNVVVDGSQSGSTIQTRGWNASTNNVVRKGDMISISGVSHTMKVKADADSDSNGHANIPVFPPVFNSVSDGTSVTTSGVTITVRVKNVDGMPTSQLVDYWGPMTVTFVEAL